MRFRWRHSEKGSRGLLCALPSGQCGGSRKIGDDEIIGEEARGTCRQGGKRHIVENTIRHDYESSDRIEIASAFERSNQEFVQASCWLNPFRLAAQNEVAQQFRAR